METILAAATTCATGGAKNWTKTAGRCGSGPLRSIRRVGFSHTEGQITHHISPNIDAERDKIIDDLTAASFLVRVYWIDGFQQPPEGRNGGGDPWHTDGRLAVGVIGLGKPAAEVTP